MKIEMTDPVRLLNETYKFGSLTVGEFIFDVLIFPPEDEFVAISETNSGKHCRVYLQHPVFDRKDALYVEDYDMMEKWITERKVPITKNILTQLEKINEDMLISVISYKIWIAVEGEKSFISGEPLGEWGKRLRSKYPNPPILFSQK